MGRPFSLALVALFVLSACGGTAAPSSTSSSPGASGSAPAALVKVKSSYGNVTPANLAPFMAKELGLFEKHGLDVDLQLIDGGAPSAAALIAGQVQFANFGGTEAMSGVAGGADVQAVALFVPVTPWQPSDLKGKAVGIATKGGSSEVALNLSLQKLGLDPAKDVTVQALGSTANLTKGMLGGAVYAGPGHPPDTVQLLASGFKVIVDLAADKVPATDNGTMVLKSYLNANRQVVQSYIDAEVEAIAAAKKDKTRTVQILVKLLKLDATKDADALSQTYDFYVQQIMPSYPHPAVTAFDYTRQQLVATNPKVKDLDVKTVVDDSFVADAEKRGVGK